MAKQETGVIAVELKYCERCGGLWLREKGSDNVYCGSCALQVADLPAPVKRKGHARLPIADQNEIRGMAAMLHLAEGGNA